MNPATLLVFISVFYFAVFVRNARTTFTTQIGPKPIWNSTEMDRLRQDLLLNYDKFSRPAQHYNATTVLFRMTVRHFDLDEIKKQLTVNTWTFLSWTDEKLKWNTSEYSGLKTLSLADHEIWQPDLFLYNSATSTSISHFGSTPVLVDNNGTVIWVPPTQYTVLCDLDLTYWPFDTQTCELVFGSWTSHGLEVDLQLLNATENIDLAINSTEWEIESLLFTRTLSKYSCCEEPYPRIDTLMVIKRRSPSYKALIITPAFVVILLNLVTFWLPPTAGEKIILNGCVGVMITLFLLYFTQKLPAMGSHTPLVVHFFSSGLYVTAFSTITAVIVLYISRTPHSQSLPWIIKQHLNGKLGKFLGLPSLTPTSSMTHRVTAEEMRDHQVTEFEDHNSSDEHQMIRPSRKVPNQQEWILFATAIDRLCFLLYSFVYLILGVVYAI